MGYAKPDILGPLRRIHYADNYIDFFILHKSVDLRPIPKRKIIVQMKIFHKSPEKFNIKTIWLSLLVNVLIRIKLPVTACYDFAINFYRLYPNTETVGICIRRIRHGTDKFLFNNTLRTGGKRNAHQQDATHQCHEFFPGHNNL